MPTPPPDEIALPSSLLPASVVLPHSSWNLVKEKTIVVCIYIIRGFLVVCAFVVPRPAAMRDLPS
jgi:hypothetical protein